MPPKNTKEKHGPANDVSSRWPSPNPYDNANTDPSHRLNLKDHGFNYLGISGPIVSPPDPLNLALTYTPRFSSTPTENSYLTHIAQKLHLGQQFIHAELAVALNPNRRMDRDATALLLCAPPISLTLYTQEVLRDLVKVRMEILKLGKDEMANEDRLQILGHEFLWTWNELGGILEGLVSWSVGMKRNRAEKIMVVVLGESLIEGWEEVKEIGGKEGEEEIV
jgi:hypothetical protein